MTTKLKLRNVGETAALALSGLLVALALAWIILACLNFSYGLWHDAGGIKRSIDEYGSQNRFRKGFHLTSKDQRVALFREINIAINSGGKGLADIRYQVDNLPEQTLLREPEVLHLQDVANLVTLGKYAAVLALLIWMTLWFYFYRQRRPAPSVLQQFYAILAVVAVVAVVVVVIGPVAVFYKMHEWVFPDGHQWFFYYQDSLMSTMMHAPELFGWIAMEWLLLTLVLFLSIQFGVARALSAKPSGAVVGLAQRSAEDSHKNISAQKSSKPRKSKRKK